jgi:hypothetical protein
MQQTKRLSMVAFCLAVLVPIAPLAAPKQIIRATHFSKLSEKSWSLDRASMFTALTGRMDTFGEYVLACVKIGTAAGIELQPIAEARESLGLAAKADANALPARPQSDADVLALKARFSEALIAVDHAMARHEIGIATTNDVLSAIKTAASILK